MKEPYEVLPGDESMAKGFWFADQSVLIKAQPNDIWPWFVQMGNGRAGWYSYDWLDNLGKASLKKINPEMQDIKIGQSFGLYSVEDFKEPEYLIFRFFKKSNMTWSLKPTDAGTQLITRVRVSGPRWLLSRTLGPGHFVMQRKQFLEIKKRVE